MRILWLAAVRRRTLGSDQIAGEIDNGGMSPRDQNKPTPHELAILKLLAEGMSTKQISGELNTTPSSIQRSVRNLRVKLNAKTDFQLGGLALLKRLVEPHVFVA